MNKYILLVGLESDPLLQYIAKHFITNNLPIVWLNLNELGKSIQGCKVGWTNVDEQGKINWQIYHKEVCGVYSRYIGPQPTLASKKQITNFNLLLHLLNEVYPTVINCPKDYWTNFSKFAQLMFLSRYDFKIPETYLQVATDFKQSGFVYKSASSIRSIVNSTTGRYLNSTEPVLIQRLIRGYNIRVHIFNNSYYATKISTQKIDYRYCKKSNFKQVILPKTVITECINITKDLNLKLSGIDLILGEDKQWYILEVNPSPSFGFFLEKSKDFRLMKDIELHFKNLVKKKT